MSHTNFLTRGGFVHGGDVSEQRFFFLCGSLDGMRASSGVQDIWTPGGTKGYSDTAELVDIVSDDAADTALGVGARRVLVTGLDEDSLLLREFVDLDGISAVQTTRKFIRIHEFRIVDTGVNGTNTGRLTAEIGGILSGVIENDSLIPSNQMMAAHFTVPESLLGTVTQIAVTQVGSGSGEITLESRLPDASLNNPPFVEVAHLPANESFIYDFAAPIPLDQRTDIRVRGAMKSGVGSVVVQLEILLCPRVAAQPNPPIPVVS